LADLTKYNPEDIRQYIETGKSNLPADVVYYMDMLELCRGMFAKYYDRDFIVKTLISPTYKLSRYAANKLVTDMLNFFYANHTVKQEAWQEIYAQRFDKLAELALWGKDDIDLARTCWKEAAEARGVYKPKPKEIPAEFYNKKIVIVSIDPEAFGIKAADRTELAKMIDEMPDLSTPERNRLKREGGVHSINIPEDLEDATFIDEETKN
jgi:hypothetical protein